MQETNAPQQTPGRRQLWDHIEIFEDSDRYRSRAVDRFSADFVLDAYDRGRSIGFHEGQESWRALVEQTFSANGKTITELSHAIKENVGAAGYDVLAIYLRVASWDEFDLLVIIPESHFCDDDFDTLYPRLYRLVDEATTDTFRCTFSFVPVDTDPDPNHPPYNLQALHGDGFLFHFLG